MEDLGSLACHLEGSGQVVEERLWVQLDKNQHQELSELQERQRQVIL
jgi:hypothetical protein